MKNKIRKIFAMLLIVSTMAALFSINANALSLNYTGSSSSNGTGATASTSGFTITYDDANSNICGYRFSIVSSNGLPKSGTKVLNVYKTDISIGDTAYFSGQRFISATNVAANKKQLANGTKVTSSTTTQGCDCYSTAAGFYSTIPQAPSSIGSWIKNSNSGYLNLQRIYYYCGSNLANATESDYVLIEPIFWVKLAGVRTAATATELAIYGAAVSGGDGYKGTDGNLYNAGTGTLWNLSNYINREFPNALYVSAVTDVYAAVTAITSGKYTYKQIIANGYGCSILTVKNVIAVNTTHTNTIDHWAWGFKGNGNNANKDAYNLTKTTYTKKKGDVYTLDASYACKIPNGFYLHKNFGSSSITGTWTAHPVGTTVTQKASSLYAEFDYYATNYNITYELNGGTNNSNNPSTYNVLYGVTLSNPTKNNADFLGWDLKINKDITIAASTHNWNYNNTLYNIVPGVEYKIKMDSARMTAGVSTMFTCIIYDSTDQKTLLQKNIPFSNLISYSMTCPETAVASHDIRILIYAGVAGSTSGKAAEFNNVTIEFSADGVNKGCGSAFTSATDLYDKLARRITGDVVFTANWEDYEVIDLDIVPIEPNAPYRLGTEVITSYWILNCANFDIIPNNNVSVVMNVYDGENIIYNAIKENTVIPQMDKNLVYFKWKIPEDISVYKLTISCLITINDEDYKTVSDEYDVIPYSMCFTPDTRFEKYAPNEFRVPETPTESVEYAKWWQWNYNDGEFVYREFDIGNDIIDLTLSAQKAPSSYFESGLLNIKSGYGFECDIIPGLYDIYGSYISFTTSIKQAVAAQYCYALFPEFNYTFNDDTCRTFENASDKYVFSNMSDMQSQHFIPLYFPDGIYNFQIVLSDCWTPAGMLTTYKTVSINISGNAYSDWYIQHR